jgi:hypothetical protein
MYAATFLHSSARSYLHYGSSSSLKMTDNILQPNFSVSLLPWALLILLRSLFQTSFDSPYDFQTHLNKRQPSSRGCTFQKPYEMYSLSPLSEQSSHLFSCLFYLFSFCWGNSGSCYKSRCSGLWGRVVLWYITNASEVLAAASSPPCESPGSY